MPMPTLKVKRLSVDATLPTRGSTGAIGYDLYASEDRVIPAGERRVVPTGIAVAFPAGHYARVAPRSGLAVKYGLDVLAGVIDVDYRGEVCVILHNNGDKELHVRREERIAQMILERADTFEVEEVSELDATVRGASGFGSTGMLRNDNSAT